MKGFRSGFLALLLFTIFTSCGSNSSSSSDEDLFEVNSTLTYSNVLCDFEHGGTQKLNYSVFSPESGINRFVADDLEYSFMWICENSERILIGNGVPNHSVTNGEFATPILAQDVKWTFPLHPVNRNIATPVKEPGFAINSVKFDPGTAGTCPDEAVDELDCDPGAGRDTWRMVALPGEVSPWKFDFGTDTSNAHVQPGGTYHYHGVPEELLPKLNTESESSMTLVGWAKDGYPIYARFGYSDALDSATSLKIVRSSYHTKDEADAGRPSTGLIPMGHFEQDWEYIEGSGDLDECNGRTGVTPEFPEGTYHYYVTDTYPFIQRCIKGALG